MVCIAFPTRKGLIYKHIFFFLAELTVFRYTQSIQRLSNKSNTFEMQEWKTH